MNKLMKKSHKGFTPIHLAIAMLIFGILISNVFYGVSVYTKKTNETRVASDLSTFEAAIKDYMLNNPKDCSDGELSLDKLNKYLTDENKAVLQDSTGSAASPKAALAIAEKSEVGRSVLKDPWGHEYFMVIDNNEDEPTAGTPHINSKGNAFIYVYTAGKDGRASDKPDQKAGKGATYRDASTLVGDLKSPSYAQDYIGTEADTKEDDSVLVVQYNGGKVYSHIFQPSALHGDKATCDNGNYHGKFNTQTIAFWVS